MPLPTMRIMTNLLANVFAHAQASRVLVGFRRRGAQVSFEVYDDGAGMDETVLTAALQQGGKGAASNGDGLGLSIVQDLCETQGYRFSIRSRPGHGTAVKVLMGSP